MRITTWGEYGLIVSLSLARRAGGGPVAARELAELERLPHDYVEQILLRLRRAGLQSDNLQSDKLQNDMGGAFDWRRSGRLLYQLRGR